MTQHDDDINAWQAITASIRKLGAPKPRAQKKPAPSSAPPIIPTAPLAMDELVAEAEKTTDESFRELFEGDGQNDRKNALPAKREELNQSPPPHQPSLRSVSATPPQGGSLPKLIIGDLTQLDRNTADRLKRGKFPIDITLDLHGLNKEAAHDQFIGTIENAAHSGARLVLVITGKGYRSEGGRAILREALPDWVNQPNLRPLLLACCPAQIPDGGDGAFYCLLKRRRNR